MSEVSELMWHAQQGKTRNRSYKGATLAKPTEAIASLNGRLHTAIADGQVCLVPPACMQARWRPPVRRTSSRCERIFPSRRRTDVAPSIKEQNA